MKLQSEYNYIKNQFNNNIAKIKEYAPKLKESKQYNDFNTRLCWDCLRAFIGTKTLCEWYEKYNCNDKHITTAGIKALKELNII